jgi:hypothetical protein
MPFAGSDGRLRARLASSASGWLLLQRSHGQEEVRGIDALGLMESEDAVRLCDE